MGLSKQVLVLYLVATVVCIAASVHETEILMSPLLQSGVGPSLGQLQPLTTDFLVCDGDRTIQGSLQLRRKELKVVPMSHQGNDCVDTENEPVTVILSPPFQSEIGACVTLDILRTAPEEDDPLHCTLHCIGNVLDNFEENGFLPISGSTGAFATTSGYLWMVRGDDVLAATVCSPTLDMS